MAYEKHQYSDSAKETTLFLGISASDTTITVADGSTFPAGGAAGKVVCTINRDTIKEERIRYTSRTGNILSGVERGYGQGGTGQAHDAGAEIYHGASATELGEANAHIVDTALDHHTQYLNTARHDITARHAYGAALGSPGTPTTIAPDATGAAGTGAAPAKEDHTHGIAAATATTITGTNAEGSSSSFARADHGHAIDNAITEPLSPTGMIAAFGAAAAPTGWLLCNGAGVSRTTYADLFAVIGTTYGVGDGSTTFNVPNLQQRFPLGKATSGTGSTLGGTGGTIDHFHGLDTTSSAAKITIRATGTDSPRMVRKTTASWTENISMASGGNAQTASASHTDGAELMGDSGTANAPFQVVNFIIRT